MSRHKSPKDQYIIDEAEPFLEWFLSTEINRIDFIIDNAGFEFFCDLIFADYLISSELVKEVYFHVKPYPIFVSDVIRKDVTQTLKWMKESSQTNIILVAERLEGYIEKNLLCVSDDFFWGMPLDMWEMPEKLYTQFYNSDLIISKGDANYRRLLGDRNWPLDTCFEEVVSYLPSSLLVLRVLKSEIGTGYSSTRVHNIQAADKLWMQNGKWGSIQFFKKERD